MPLLKLAFCTCLSLAGLVLAWRVHGARLELIVLRRAALLAGAARLVLAITIYVFAPQLNEDSDAALYYLPHTLKVLQGEIPNRDFSSSYSPLFHYLLAPGVRLWPSTGAIVVSMLLLEAAMLYIYARRAAARISVETWRVVFLYLISPISFYWIALTGYNGAIIAAFNMFALVLAARARPILAGLAATIGFLCSKLLSLLAAPAIVFFDRTGRWARLAPLAASLCGVACLPLFEITVFKPLAAEYRSHTSGNVWFLLSALDPRFQAADWSGVLPLMTFAPLFAWALVRYLSTAPSTGDARFDRAAGFVTFANCLFMFLSRKSYPFYAAMFLIFLIHTVAGRPGFRPRRLAPLAILAATTTFEGSLWLRVRYRDLNLEEPVTIALLLIDTLIVSCYIYYAILASRSLAEPRNPPSAGPE